MKNMNILKKNNIILLLVLILTISCRDDIKYEKIKLDSGYVLSGKTHKKKKQGFWKVENKYGKLYAYGYIQDNNLEGRWIYFNQTDGTIDFEEFYIDGIKNGREITYDKNGQIRMISEYYNDSIKRVIAFNNNENGIEVFIDKFKNDIIEPLSYIYYLKIDTFYLKQNFNEIQPLYENKYNPLK